jgi:hypothetical protein
MVNTLLEDGIVWELKVPVCGSGLGIPEKVETGPLIAAWINRFRTHEQAFLNFVYEPTSANLRQAVVADPTIAEPLVDKVLPVLESKLKSRNEMQYA